MLSVAWAPGERLLASTESGPNCHVDALNNVPKALLTLFFQGHLQFVAKSRPVSDRSREYRAAILDCVDALRKGHLRYMEQGNGEMAQVAGSAEQIARDGHTVWHFVEAVYLSDKEDDTHVSERLAQWYQISFGNLHEKAKEYLRGASVVRDENDFWDLITALVAVCDRSLALAVIERRLRQPDGDDEQWAEVAGAAALGVLTEPRMDDNMTPIAVAEAVLRHCPVDVLVSRNDGRWHAWQDNCVLWSESDELSASPRAKQFLGLLGGTRSAMIESCTSWTQMVLAGCAYGRGSLEVAAMRSSVAEIAAACGEASSAFRTPADLAGGAVTEAALGNVGAAIVSMGSSLNISWFAAHLCDLLVQSGKISAAGDEEWAAAHKDIGMREFYLRDFARRLERNRGMWRLAAAYYLECPTVGQELLKAMLARVNFESAEDPSVEKVLGLCAKYKLSQTSRDVCQRLGAGCLQQGNFGGAMAWYARGGLNDKARSVATEALQQAEEEGPGSSAARGLQCVVAALAGARDPEIRESFDFLRVYADFQEAVAECAVAEDRSAPFFGKCRSVALEALLRLIGGGGLPRKHWAVALREVSGLLQGEDGKDELAGVSVDVMQELVGALQLVSGPYRSPVVLEGLKRRLSFEAKFSRIDEATTSVLDMKDVEKSLHDVRQVFIRALSLVAFA